MLRMCLNAVVLNDSLILLFLLLCKKNVYLISELFNVFCLFILSVLFYYGLFICCSSVLCSLNQGIAAKEPCAQSILPELMIMMRSEERRVGRECRSRWST